MTSFVTPLALPRHMLRSRCSLSFFAPGKKPSTKILKRRRCRHYTMQSDSSTSDETSSPNDEDDNKESELQEPVEYIPLPDSSSSSTIPGTQASSASSAQQWEQGQVRELPLFPLNMVLQPGGVVPLHVFEMRYRLLFNRLREGDGKFGIVMTDKEKQGSVARVGCEAELVRFESLPDGRIMTVSTGKERFRIIRFTEKEPYLKAMVQLVTDDGIGGDEESAGKSLETPEDDGNVSLDKLELQVWEKLQDVLRLSNKLYGKGVDLKELIKDLSPPSAGAVKDEVKNKERRVKFSFAVSQILDMSVKQQQVLLQTRSTRKRLQKQDKILESARQYLAAQVTLKDALDKSK